MTHPSPDFARRGMVRPAIGFSDALAGAGGGAIHRVLILGNSHIAALRLAGRADAGRWPGLSPTYAGAWGEALDALRLVNGVLEPVTPEAVETFLRINGQCRFPLTGFDAFVIAGCELSMFRTFAALRGIEGMGAAAVRAVRDTLSHTLAARLARMIRSGSAAPIFVAQQPNPAWIGEDAPQLGAFLRARRNGTAPALAALFAKAAALALPTGTVLLPQPDATRLDAIFTRPAYSRGSRRLAGGIGQEHPPQDYLHANADYGALVLDALAARLDAQTDPRGIGVSPRL